MVPTAHGEAQTLGLAVWSPSRSRASHLSASGVEVSLNSEED